MNLMIFFTSIGPSLNKKFDTSNEFHWTQPDCVHTFSFNDITEESVHSDLCALPMDSNLDIFQFDAKLLRLGAYILVASLTTLFNLSLQQQNIPSDLKNARVTPIYKGKGSVEDPSNYRPISVIPHVAKLLEKRVQSQLLSYLQDHKLISCEQSAFIKQHSTHTAVHKVIDDVLDNINEGYLNGACFFDLTKCFDTIDHEILLRKLERYGVRGPSLNWFTDYLSNRSQVVRCNNQLSHSNMISTGVPQGSVLGPILFLIFINDLPSCLQFCTCNLFADDAEVHASGTIIDEVETQLQHDTNNMTTWFHHNRLTASAPKSFSMMVTCNPNIDNLGLCINIDNTPLDCRASARYLGVHTDSKLKWDEHINKLCNKISPKIGLLRKLKQCLPIECLEQVYKSTIQPHIDYCITVWGFAPSKYTNQVQRLQNGAARIITGNYDWTVRGINLVSELGWQNVAQRRDYFTALQVFKGLNGMAPDYINDLFTYVRDINTRQTRNAAANNLYVPKVNKHVFKQSLQYNGAMIWNSLPDNFKTTTDLDTFKSLVRKQFS